MLKKDANIRHADGQKQEVITVHVENDGRFHFNINGFGSFHDVCEFHKWPLEEPVTRQAFK